MVKLLAIAIKFAPGGQVTLSANMTGAMDLAIHVADTGCGVPASQLEQVFQLFHQVENDFPLDQWHRPWPAIESETGGAAWRHAAA